MGRDKSGPYKVVSNNRSYQIVVASGSDAYSFYRVVVPDSGDGEMTRRICRLLNADFLLRNPEDEGLLEVDTDDDSAAVSG